MPDFDSFMPKVANTFDAVVRTLVAETAAEEDGGALAELQAAQMVAVIALADRFLVNMPVISAFRFRSTAKALNAGLDALGTDEDMGKVAAYAAEILKHAS